MNRPNVILLSTDQQTWDALSAAGNEYVHTPNIDRIYASGLAFSRAHCTNPVCVPARSSWATGLYSSESGCPFNGGAVHDDIPDIGELLREGGYHTAHSGKWHVDGRDVSRGFEPLYFGRQRIAAGGAEYYDSATTRSVVDYLTSQPTEPFYLQVGYINPHDICEWEHAHEGRRIPDPTAEGVVDETLLPPLPASFDYDQSETVVQKAFRRHPNALIHPQILEATRHWSEVQWRFLAWMYYRFVERVDREIGLILDAIQSTGLSDRTALIFTSDHGEACGRHRLFQKFSLYEESVRTPLVLVEPGRLDEGDSRSSDALVSGTDVFATICDLASVDRPDTTRGRSLLSLADDRTVTRKSVFIENNYWERAIVTNRHKFITEYVPLEEPAFVAPSPSTHRFGRSQLFDLVTDPDETVNLADDPALESVVSACRELLITEELSLTRRPLQTGRPRNVVRAAHTLLLDAWNRES